MTLITADNLNAQGQRVRFDPAEGYTLIYSGTGDDPFAAPGRTSKINVCTPAVMPATECGKRARAAT